MAGHLGDSAAFDAPDAYYFDGARFEPRSGRLTGEGLDLRLRPKTAGVLALLLARPGDLIEKSELVDRVWGGAAGDESIAVCVAELRRVLGDEPQRPRLIATVHRRGYRFVGTVSTSPPGADDVHGPELFGRSEALAELAEWWSAAREGERTTGFIAGEAGAGKSALVQAFAHDVRAQADAVIGEGRCADRHGAEPYLPFLDVLASLGRGANGARFLELLWDFAPSWLLQLPGLARGDAVDRLRERRVDRSPARLLREAAEVLDALAAVAPVMIVLEDLHTADGATIELVSYLAQRPTRARLLLVATYRPEDGSSSHGRLGRAVGSLRALRRCRHHDLAPLDADAVDALLRVRLAPAVPAPGFVRQLLARTEGNALFVTTLVDRLVDDDALHEVDGTSRPRAPITDLGVPLGVGQLIAERVARFGDADRRALLAGAAAGLEFTPAEAAAGLVPIADPDGTAPDAGELERRLLHIADQSAMIAEVDPVDAADGSVSARFRFRHELVREVLRGQLGGARGVLVHRGIGELLETQPDSHREASVIAEHFELGHDFARAAIHYARASDVARDRIAPTEALELARRGVALADRPGADLAPVDRLAVRLSLVSATLGVHGVSGPEIAAAVDEAEAVADSVAEPRAAGRARYLFWSIAFLAGDIRTAEVRLRALELDSTASAHSDPLLERQLENARTLTDFAAGRPAAALHHAARFRLLEETAPAEGVVERAMHEIGMLNRSGSALASWLVGRTDDACRIAHDGLRMARADGRPGLVCRSLWPVAAVHQLTGDRRSVTKYAEQIRRITEADVAWRWMLVGGVFAGWAAATGRPAGGTGGAGPGTASLRASLDRLLADGMGFARPYHLALAAEASITSGDHEAAIASVDDAIARSESTGDRWFAAELLRLRAEALRVRAAGERSAVRSASRREADGLLTEAVALARAQGALALERRAEASLAARG